MARVLALFCIQKVWIPPQTTEGLYPEKTTLQQKIALNLSIIRVYAAAMRNEALQASSNTLILHSLRRTRRLSRE
jgi:hypothetical protein